MNVFTLPRVAISGGFLGLALLVALPALQDATAPKDTKPEAPRAEAAPAKTTAKVGEQAPDFTLKNLNDEDVTLADLTKAGKVVVLEWFNPDCPVSRAYHEPDSTMGKLAAAYADRGVAWLAINSGAPGKQGAGKERNVKAAEEFGVKYPVLLDEPGTVGRLYGAKTTPHMYVIDKEGVLRYAGAIDNGSGEAKGDSNYVQAALDEILAGKEVTTKEARAFGCSVKYAK
jgi:peroxiredoxin